MSNRRNFIKTASAGAVALSIPSIVTSALAASKPKKWELKKDDVILFQGDSITDFFRKGDEKTPNTNGMLGVGYALLTAADLLARYPEKNLKFYNRGVSGNKVYQLAERWDADCLEIKPNVLSILVGVNDYWHTLFLNYKGTIDTYTSDYKKLLDRTLKALPDVKLVIGEPFGVKGVKAVTDAWYPDFDKYRQAARDIASQYNAVFIPYQSVFDKAQEAAPGSYWTPDGVHPSVAGAGLMAHAWLETVKG